MIISIYRGYDTSYIMLGSKNPEFVKRWGDKITVSSNNIYKDLENISNWVSNELGEECLFEVR